MLKILETSLGVSVSTWKALARARAPSFSRRFLPAMNTLSLSGAPCADDCLWHAIRDSARIYTHHTALLRSALGCRHVFTSLMVYCQSGTSSPPVWLKDRTKVRFEVCYLDAHSRLTMLGQNTLRHSALLPVSSPFLRRSPCHSCWASAPSRCGRKGSSAAARFPSHRPAQRRYRSGPAPSAGPLNSSMHSPGTSDAETESMWSSHVFRHNALSQ